VLFRERIVEEADAIVGGADELGFEGIEIGARFYGTEKKQELIDLFEGRGIVLAGLHIGTTLEGWAAAPEDEAIKVRDAARFLDGFPYRNIIMSCKAAGGEVDLRAAARNMEAAAAGAAAEGAHLLYHNHGWEFEDGSRVFDAIHDGTSSMGYALDLGWVIRAGVDAVSLLGRIGSRVPYLHLRDVAGDGFADLGDGEVDYGAVIAAICDATVADPWVLLEYEGGEQDMARYAAGKKYLEGLLADRSDG
jgi:sugar phosphate isomerase/epimerase